MKKDQRSGKKALLWIIPATLAVVIAAVVMIFMLAPSEKAPPAPDGKLYWNVERSIYEDMSNGVSTRKADENGIYTILFSVQGEQVKLTTADRALVDQIDSASLMSLAFDRDGMICDVLSLQELGMGKEAYQFYVESAQDGTVVANSSKDFDGEAVQLSLAENLQIYYTATQDMLCGIISDIRERDRIMGVTDAQGQLTHVYVVERTYTGTKELRYCQHCEKEVAWWSWDSSNSVPNIGGHFYLTEDVGVSRQCNIPGNTAIILDLQGHTVTGHANKRIYATWGEGAYLAIVDSSAAQTGKLMGQGTQLDQGGIIWVRYGLVELYGGLLDASQVHTLKNGAAVYVRTGATFNMHGGEIRGGISKAITNDSGSVVNGRAGNVYVGGTFNMYGGRIQDGYALGIYEGSTSTMGIGGNLYVADTGVANISGGVIENGEATGGGGNIYTMGQVNISADAHILGGLTEGPKKNGGSIYVYKTGVLHMEGGTVSGGQTASGSGGNICSTGTVSLTDCIVENGSAHQYGDGIYATAGKLSITNSTVTGDVRVGKDVDFALSGVSKLTGLEMPKDSLVNVDGLREGSSIAVTASGYFTEKTSNNCAGCFKADGYRASVIYTGQRLFVGRSGCLCGKSEHEAWCDGTSHLWTAWVEDKTLPTEDGYYYLTKNVTREYQTSIGNSKEKTAVNLTLDLNGKTVTAIKGKRVFFVTAGSILTVTDTGTNGQLRSKGGADQNGGIFMVGSDSVMNLYAGTIVGTETVRSDSGNGDGGAGSVIGTLNMYGGSITGGVAQRHGGCLAVSGVLNLYGGSIRDGQAMNLGGNIYCSGQVNIYGGTVSGGKAGTATSDNILVAKEKTLTISGGFVDGGIRQAGTAKIVLKDSPVITGSGISLADGTRVSIEGTLAQSAQVVVSKDGTWLYFADTAIPENAAAFTVPEGYEIKFDETRNQLYYAPIPEPFEHSHGEDLPWAAWDGTGALEDGGYYCLTGDVTLEKAITVKAISATICLNGYTITGADNARLFFIRDGGTLSIHDCSEAGSGKLQAVGAYTENGGNIMVGSNSVLNLYGGTVCGGNNAAVAGKNGGNIYVTGTLNLYGGKVTGGVSPVGKHGGNVYVTGSMTMSGGVIDGGMEVSANATCVTVSQDAVICGLYLPSGKTVTIEGTLGENASIGLVGVAENVRFAHSAAAENAQKFYCVDGDQQIAHDTDTGMLYVMGKIHSHCLCNGTAVGLGDHVCEDTATWTAWTDKNALPTDSGSYYLDVDVTLSAMFEMKGKLDLKLCLNGHTITGPGGGKRVFLLRDADLHITDCQGTGVITNETTDTLTGGLIYQYSGSSCNQYNNSVNLYGGTLTTTGTARSGGVVYLGNNYNAPYYATFNLYGGTVTGGKTTSMGGNITMTNKAQLNMYGGVISGGEAGGVGGNISQNANAGTLRLLGGQIIGNDVFVDETVILGGQVKIDRLNLKDGHSAALSDTLPLTGEASVGIVKSKPEQFATNVADETMAEFFAQVGTSWSVVYDPEAKTLSFTQ